MASEMIAAILMMGSRSRPTGGRPGRRPRRLGCPHSSGRSLHLRKRCRGPSPSRGRARARPWRNSASRLAPPGALRGSSPCPRAPLCSGRWQACRGASPAPRPSVRPQGGAIEKGVDVWAFGLLELPISFPMVSFSLLGLLYSEPNASRRATPPSTFQQKPGHSHK